MSYYEEYKEHYEEENERVDYTIWILNQEKEVREILDKLRSDPNYYLSVNNRKKLGKYLENFEKTMQYVT